MNFISMVFGSGARAKRARRGTERDGNQYDEPARKFMQHGDSMGKSRRWVKHKHAKQQPAEDRAD